MIRVLARAWACAVVVLIAGGAGLFALTASSTSTSLVRMGLAAGVLALVSTVVTLALVPRTRCRPAGRGSVAAFLPVLLGVSTAAYVGLSADVRSALLAALPWWTGGLLGAAANPLVGEVRRPALLTGSVEDAHRRGQRRGRRSGSVSLRG